GGSHVRRPERRRTARRHDAALRRATIRVLLNKGGGRFAAGATYRTGPGPWELELVDLNGDSRPDAVTPGKSGISVLLNRGDGTFEPRHDYATGKDPGLAIRDVNSDGKPDLVAPVFRANVVSVFINAGDGTFESRRDYATGTKPTGADTADLHADEPP